MYCNYCGHGHKAKGSERVDPGTCVWKVEAEPVPVAIRGRGEGGCGFVAYAL